MNATRIADTARTRDLLALAREYQAASPHCLYGEAARVDQRTNDTFIRTLQSAPDMSLAGLQEWSDSQVRRDAASGILLAMGATCFLAAGAVLGGGAGLAIMGGGIVTCGMATAVVGHQKRMHDFSENLRSWEAVLATRPAPAP